MKKLFIAILVVIILTVCYFLFFRINKEKAIDIIVKAKTDRNAALLSAMDEEYLIAWANGIRWHKVTFTHQGKNYLVETGKAM